MYDRILLATAFDDTSEMATEHALRLCRSIEASCIVLHVIESIGDEPGDEELDEFYTNLRGKAGENMRALAARFDEAAVPMDWDVRIGTRWETILEMADKHDVDLIVMGSRPVLDQDEPHLGSTSHQVFFASHIPLLVVRA